MTNTEQIQLFISLFRGRTDVYARYWEKDGRSGYSPAYEFNWNEFMAFKAKGGKLSDFPNKKSLLLTVETIENHLSGRQTIGIYPLLKDNTSYFIAADFDGENWQEDAKAFLKICKKYKIPAYIERSKSGKGCHAWIFFEDRYPAYKSRKIILTLIQQVLNFSQFEKEISFDRLFPNQDYHTNLGFGNLIALPFQKAALENENTVFLDQETLTILPNQWKFLETVEKLPVNSLSELYEKLVGNGQNTKEIKKKKSLNKEGLTIVLRNQIFLKKDQLSIALVNFLKEHLNFFNKEFIVKQKLGISTYKTEKYFKLISETHDSVTIPRGFLLELLSFCEENTILFHINDERIKQKQVKFTSHIILRDYQQKTLDEVNEQENGVIVAPAGSGKTIIALELIARKSQPALILVHRQELLKQWVERIIAFLGIPKMHIGEISGSKKKIGKEITVAMVQSLQRMKNLNELTTQFGTIIVDECHHMPAKLFRELISQFNSYYLYGLTATPKRKYNDEKIIYYYLGNIIASMEQYYKTSESVIDNNQVLAIHIRETNLSVPFEYKTDSFEAVSKILTFDSSRNILIVQDVLKEVMAGHKILILTERKEHIDTLYLYLKNHAEIITLTGDDSLSKRKIKIEQIHQGHFQIIIATGQLFGEGTDISTINCLFLVYPFSFEGKLAQYIGRIQRVKEKQIVYDYHDKNIAFFDRLFQKRMKYYKKLKVQIIF